MDSKPSSLDALRIDRSQIPRETRGGRWWWILLLLLTLGGTGGWWVVRGKGISVKTATVQVRDSGGGGRILLNASGYVTTRLQSTVSSKVTGKVAEILIEEGMKVEKDQVLARLDASNVEAGLHSAEAQLEAAKLNLAEAEPMLKFAETEWKRFTALEGSRSVSQSDRSKAEAEVHFQQARLAHLLGAVKVAQRQVEEWQQQVEDTIIRAPFAGVVTTKAAQPGETISPMSAGGFTRTGICSLVDMASLEIEVDVGESYINRVKPGQPVEATLDAYPDWKIPCKVIAIIPTADRQKATVRVRVAFEKLDPRILPEMGVKVAFQSDEPAASTVVRKVLSAPKGAVQKSAGRDVAWVVRDGKVERRAVTVAESDGDNVTLTAGLAAGETVVLDAPANLADGAAVTLDSSR